MPDMPMPPMPTKWMGPVLEGSFIGALELLGRGLENKVGQPRSGIGTGIGRGSLGLAAECLRLCEEVRQQAGQIGRGELGLEDEASAPRSLQGPGVLELVVIEGMGQR